MLRRRLIFTLLAVLLVVSAAAYLRLVGEQDESVDFKQAYAKDFRACPMGHKQLKDVPVVYGLIVDMDEALQKDVDELRVWLGGCIPMPEKNRVVCPVCRYSYESVFSRWTKSSLQKDEFARTLSDLIANFPVAPDTHGYFTQENRNNGKKILDGVSYWTKSDYLKVDRMVSDYLTSASLAFSRTNRPMPEFKRHYIEYGARTGENFFRVEIMQDYECHVKAEESPDESFGY